MLNLILGNLELVIGGIGTLVGLFFVRKSVWDAVRNKQRKATDKRTERIEDAIDDTGSDHWRQRLQRRDK